MKHRGTPPPPPPSCTTPFEAGGKLCRFCRLRPDAKGLRRCSRMVVASPAMRAVMLRVARIAPSDAPVVVLGEPGTGKEVLARLIHANGPRRDRPFVVARVAGAPPDTVEAELFGRTRGGADGLFAAADGGTLFVDEVAELPPAAQGTLLRVLDGGDGRGPRADVRLVCGTAHDLAARVAEGRFRQDLYYRLRVFALEMPPLRARREDVLPLARMFLAERGRAAGGFTRAAEEALGRHRWPGNVRELANAVRHGGAFARGKAVDAPDLPESVTHPRAPGDPGTLRPLAQVERDHVERVLSACAGRQADAARVLGIGRTTLWRKLRALGLDAAAAPRAQ